jgi:ribonuclease R
MMDDKILKQLGRRDYVPANVPELLRGLKMAPNQQQNLQKSLRMLEHSGQIARTKGNRYILSKEADLIPGRIQITRQGRGFLAPDDPKLGEISIPANSTATALHEDRVLVRREVRIRRGKVDSEQPDTGTVVRILERRRTNIVGTLKRGKQFLYVIPDDPRMPQDIYVPTPKDVGRPARSGDKVVVELLQWESRHTNPEGRVTEVLGPPTAEGVDMLGVLRHYDLPLKFPRKVLEDVKQFGNEITPSECEDRTDCRMHSVITIDPADARDFDDAFFLKKVAKGWKLWVHIADVSHYVKSGSALDVEARKRGNSTYLVDRVIPMLPEALSNELCSLKPAVDRLTKCVEFLINDEGQVLRSKCYAAVIHSQKRYSYEEALSVLNAKPNDPIECMLHDATKLAQKIRRRRFKSGSLELDFPETKIRLDEKGRVRIIERTYSDESHQLIEEFMLLANEAVAARLIKQRRSAIHRIHENPDPIRLREYREEVLAHGVSCGNLEKPAEVQKLLKKLGTLAIGPALKIGFLKSLMRACYSVEPLGHYGLAKANYTHFTSPIRRYADLIVHRTLFEKAKNTQSALKQIADHVSLTERNSADAERDSKNVKLFAYLTSQLKSGKPHIYEGMVTDIRNFGFFVDVADLGMSGLVPLSILEDDFYEMDTNRSQITGRRTRRVIRLGDIVKVQVAKVDAFKKQVDFRILPTEKKVKRKRSPQKTSDSRDEKNSTTRRRRSFQSRKTSR